MKGQLLLSLIIGTSAGLGMWLLGSLGLRPGRATSTRCSSARWVAVTELIPYLGPWLGAIPPFLYALVVHPVSAIWVALLFLGIHQIEGHVVVPNVMGSALRLHPLLVIFGLLAGGEIYGLPGALVALPLLAVGRAIWEFFSERVELEPWGRASTIPVEVELDEPRVEPRAAGRSAGERRAGRRRRPLLARRAAPAAVRQGRRARADRLESARRDASRWSGRTERASRRCSRCWPARSSRAEGTVERRTACASAGRRSARRSTGG